MIENLAYILLALFGIGFLVFIHELGHYIVARRVGITVEVFAIGFGKAIYEWEHKGVKWKIGWLPFGGYVKMAGTEKKGSIEPYQIPDGYFGKKPWDRIKVAAMGPIFNLVFALLAFTLLWALGGRLKPFSEFSKHIGWVDRSSDVYAQGIQPGDQITTFNGRPFHSFNDLLYGSVLDNQTPVISGLKIDYYSEGKTSPFEYTFKSETPQTGMERAAQIFNTIGPASYLYYDRNPDGSPRPLHEGSPLRDSGITYGDRLLWVDGELVFSTRQLIEVLNDGKVLLTVQRGEKTFLTRIPRMKVADVIFPSAQIEELDDWRHEAGLTLRVQDLYFIPYNLTAQAVVENSLSYVDANSRQQNAFEQSARSEIEIPLEKGDRILAVDGLHVASSYALLTALQNRHIQIIVQKKNEGPSPSWKEADQAFQNSFDLPALKKMVDSIGTPNLVQMEGNLRFLRPVVPISVQNFPLSPEKKKEREDKLNEQRKSVEKISDSKQREAALKELEQSQKRLLLGITLADQSVRYNPTPFTLFGNVLSETWRTLSALVTGYLSPKNIMGPVGIVQVIHGSWMSGVREGIYWLGMISMNLGMLNLLPIPVLDGGHILFAIIESITKKPLKAKTMERLIIPFVVLLVIFFIYLTYHDLSRLFSRFF